MKKSAHVIALIFAWLAFVAIVWWLFGWRRETLGPSTMTVYRFFGRNTLLSIDFDGDGRVDTHWIYTWRHPQFHHELPQEVREDRNFDGKVDTWSFPLNVHSFMTNARYEIDLDGDEKADWVFVDVWGSGMERVVKRRGY